MALNDDDHVSRVELNPSGHAIGIDLGTTNSCIGYFTNNDVEILTTSTGKRIIPSYVFYNDSNCIVGESAVRYLTSKPNHVVYDSKRMIGANYDDVVVSRNQPYWTFKVQKDPGSNRPVYAIDEIRKVLPEEVSSQILKELIQIAQDRIKTTNIKAAVIAVPAHFSQGQKEATLHAAHLAGIEKVKLITEPTAAAFAYGYDHRRFDGYNIFVFDLGGGTCDVSIVKVEQGQFKVIGHAGDVNLGGRDYDNCLIQYFDKEYNLGILDGNSEIITKRKMRLRGACEKLKIELSHPEKQAENIDLDEVVSGQPEISYSYKDFKALVADLTRRGRKLCVDALEEADLTPDDIDKVLLVGGATRMRVIKDMLSDLFQHLTLSEAINPDTAIAHGATLRAAQLMDPTKSESFGIVDKLSMGIGVALVENRYELLFDRTTTIPAISGKRVYCTSVNNQEAMAFNIYEGERLPADTNHHIMSFELKGLPKKKAEEVQATLQLHLDENGILSAIAECGDLSEESRVSHKDKKATGKQIEDMLTELEQNRDFDLETERENVARSELRKNIEFIKWDAEEKKKKKFKAKELEDLLKQCKEIDKWLNNSKSKITPEIREKYEKLDKDSKRLLAN